MMHRLLLSVMILVVLAACGEKPNMSADSLRRGLSAAPETLDPLQARSVAASVVLGDLYEGLLSRDAYGKLTPGAATNWRLSADELVWTFSLRQNLNWSDGTSLTAADFVRAWQALAAPSSTAFYTDLLDPVARDPQTGLLDIDAIDAQTLVVKLRAPQADFLERLSHAALSPRATDPLLSNGAFRQVSGDVQSYVLLERNPHFHSLADVAIPSVRYEWFEQEQTEYAAYQSGSLDITSRVPRAVFREAERPPDLHTAPYLGVVYLSFNMRNPLSLTLRRQLSAAVDRQALAEVVLGRGETPAYGLIPPGSRNAGLDYQPRSHTLPVTPAVESREQLSIRLSYASSDENRVVAAALQQMWQTALPSLTVTLENKEFRVLLAESSAGTFEGLIRSSWIADFNDASQFLNIFATNAAANASGFSDARFDTLLEAIATTNDLDRRASLMSAAEGLLADQQPVIPLYFFVSKHFVHPRVTGWQDNALDIHYSRYLRLTPASEI